MKRLILVRHGETDWNRVSRYQGFARTPLNERGRRQAKQVARRVAGWDIDVLYASDLPRTVETAQPIANRLGLPIIKLEALREIDVGEWEGLTVTEIQAEHTENWDTYISDPINTARKGGESLGELATRVNEVFQRWEEEHAAQTVLAVTHGGPIKALVCTVPGLPLGYRMHLRIGNASITTFVHENGRWYLQVLNDRCHLA
ncbi:MAG: Phosphoserine phosphatase 1 [Anaerolineales bacterium]|nr:Phosphoserine phosphatase 1 [Anaerolineales bacterium]